MADFEKKEDRDEVGWNISAHQARHISILMVQATNAFMSGNLGVWRTKLSGLRENINYDLTKEERDELNKMESEMIMSAWKKYRTIKAVGKKVPHSLLKQKGKLFNQIQEYQRLLYDHLKNLGYFPNKEDRTKLSF